MKKSIILSGIFFLIIAFNPSAFTQTPDAFLEAIKEGDISKANKIYWEIDLEQRPEAIQKLVNHLSGLSNDLPKLYKILTQLDNLKNFQVGGLQELNSLKELTYYLVCKGQFDHALRVSQLFRKLFDKNNGNLSKALADMNYVEALSNSLQRKVNGISRSHPKFKEKAIEALEGYSERNQKTIDSQNRMIKIINDWLILNNFTLESLEATLKNSSTKRKIRLLAEKIKAEIEKQDNPEELSLEDRTNIANPILQEELRSINARKEEFQEKERLLQEVKQLIEKEDCPTPENGNNEPPRSIDPEELSSEEEDEPIYYKNSIGLSWAHNFIQPNLEPWKGFIETQEPGEVLFPEPESTEAILIPVSSEAQYNYRSWSAWCAQFTKRFGKRFGVTLEGGFGNYDLEGDLEIERYIPGSGPTSPGVYSRETVLIRSAVTAVKGMIALRFYVMEFKKVNLSLQGGFSLMRYALEDLELVLSEGSPIKLEYSETGNGTGVFGGIEFQFKLTDQLGLGVDGYLNSMNGQTMPSAAVGLRYHFR